RATPPAHARSWSPILPASRYGRSISLSTRANLLAPVHIPTRQATPLKGQRRSRDLRFPPEAARVATPSGPMPVQKIARTDAVAVFISRFLVVGGPFLSPPRKLPACGRFLSSALISRIKLTVNVRSGPELEYTQIRGAWRHNAGMATSSLTSRPLSFSEI